MNKDQGSLAYLFLACLVAALGGLLFGFDTAVISGAEGMLKVQFHLSTAMHGWIVSSALVGCLLGSAIAGTLSDRFGRKRVLLLAAVLFTLCAVGSAIPQTPWHLVVARLIGVALPIFSQVCGINVLIYYGLTVLQEAGLTKDQALLWQAMLAPLSGSSCLRSFPRPSAAEPCRFQSLRSGPPAHLSARRFHTC